MPPDVSRYVGKMSFPQTRSLRLPLGKTGFALGVGSLTGCWSTIPQIFLQRRKSFSLVELIRPNPESSQFVWAETVDQRYIGGVTAIGHDDPADAWNVVARIERAPRAAEINLDPGGVVHRIENRDADVAEVAIHVPRRHVHAPTKGDRKMRVVAANAAARVVDVERRPGRRLVLIVERDVLVGEIADRLYPLPARRHVLKEVPGDLAEPVGFAIAASEKVDEHLVRQVGNLRFGGVDDDGIVEAGILDRSVALELQVTRGRDEPTT